ncbi:GL12859 [Drosophila persimilis]|uniref:GL12859 n=1 Tax=Drosophila persimilis TaxID=7234 RepID=B4IS31_DROPE|nr:GL12859 [Drosophila persimilis]
MKIHISEVTYQLLQSIGSYVCIERGLTSIKVSSEARVTCEPIGSRIAYKPELTPDLISTVDTVDAYCSMSRTSMDHTVLQYRSPTALPVNIRTGACNCATKCLYSRRSDDNVTNSHETPEFPKMTEPTPMNCSHLCVCRLNSSQLFNNRSPRSAPSITFRL